MAGTGEPQQNRADGPPPAYFGIGCLTAVAGFAGGGMIAVLIAKIVGALTRCAADAESGAPCNWSTYWVRGALVGMILLPAISLWRLRRGRQRAQHSERG
ncbi:MAG TPA: hypothetical protein VL524_19590 [Gemmatimonadaceae bacterium]|jgi:hypothetical protein|nr:hypothetical protein [Gemmatimonadaceae bacterium]